ncbi:MAG TPA: 2,3-bisphosphoglycerate-independent phosphoglycerate mutase, partial [Gammaproteobacteria bacterium]|nr:2,3-bisphosphoglycerate-independent phosphoglycerate mutase [Gammaproteobacteria bacterium]
MKKSLSPALSRVNTHHPLALIILDGWGHRTTTDANAIAAAHKPNWDYFLQHYPHTVIGGSGHAVGLPANQMGNSEVGHLNMGAGRIVYQDLTRIDEAIANGDFFTNPILIQALTQANRTDKAVHFMGLLSAGGVHSHEKHLHAALELAAKLKVSRVYLHPFLDGRDTPPRSAQSSLQALQQHCEQLHCGQIVSLIGRYYAMDRDHRWNRVQQAYDLIVAGKTAYHVADALTGLDLAYARGENDEFVQATAIHPTGTAPVTIQDGDTVVFMNFRADRARELTQSLLDPQFQGFTRTTFPQLGQFVCLTEYDKLFNAPVAFPSIALPHILAKCLSEHHLRQLRIAETEKYAHVTFFFNGGVEAAYPGEDRILIPSPKVATYDLQPEMNAPALTERIIQELSKHKYDVIIANFANADMVGHTGNFAAT